MANPNVIVIEGDVIVRKTPMGGDNKADADAAPVPHVEEAEPDMAEKKVRSADYMDNSDIKGSEPYRHFSHVKSYRNGQYSGKDKNLNLNTTDISPKKRFTNRVSNPLDPNYDLPSKSGRRIIKIGPIEKN